MAKRPPNLPPDLQRKELVRVRLRIDERKLLEKLARAKRQTLSAYLRDKVLT